jgi:glycosyltransferase involved in cell wall biosynthesis
MQSTQPLNILQVLPALHSGGVERGTIEFARELVKQGHRSSVMSNGGQLVERLIREGSEHIPLPVHKKSLLSLRHVGRIRRAIEALQPDIVHVRSRLPAWLIWLALRKIPKSRRPHLVSTFHGLYSVNRYSAIMAKAEHCIAVSDCVQAYIEKNYGVPPEHITRIYRGLDPTAFNLHACTEEWKQQLFNDYPELKDKKIILMPGRLTRWKGQEAFLQMMALLILKRSDVHGVVVGDAEPQKEHYFQELLEQRDALGLQSCVSFMGHRNDIQAFYGLADITCHMSNKEEPFGRTVPEAIACGSPVIAFDRGGASESLNYCYPEGLVETDNLDAFVERVCDALESQPDLQLPEAFYLDHQVSKTLEVYHTLMNG